MIKLSSGVARARPRNFPLISLFLLALFGVSACGSTRPADQPKVRFAEAPSPTKQGEFPNWPVAPEILETKGREALAANRFEEKAKKATAQGATGAAKATLFFPDLKRDISFKWKPAPRLGLDDFNNSPRREIAAYEVQKLFLKPEDYVVPTVLTFCAPIAELGPDDDKTPTIPGTKCILGTFSLWLNDIDTPGVWYDEERFVGDPTYAYYLSNFNIFTYIINHKDAVIGNVGVSTIPGHPQVFSIDNGIAFDPFLYDFFVDQWDVIRVAALRKESIDRLRKLRREDLDHLGIVAQLEKDRYGILRPAPHGGNLAPGAATRVVGGTVQLGLSTREIDDIWERIQNLIAEVDRGEIAVFRP